MKPIFLIGFMGSGKTTLCRALNHATGINVIDLDDYIVEKSGMEIREYFDRFGEDEFRRLEHETLASLASEADDVIIACGGGTPCYSGNMELMNDCGTTVFLEAPVDVLHSRLILGRDKRPLIAALGDDELRLYIVQMLEKRAPWYSLSRHRFDSSLLENEQEIKSTTLKFVNRFLPHFKCNQKQS